MNKFVGLVVVCCVCIGLGVALANNSDSSAEASFVEENLQSEEVMAIPAWDCSGSLYWIRHSEYLTIYNDYSALNNCFIPCTACFPGVVEQIMGGLRVKTTQNKSYCFWLIFSEEESPMLVPENLVTTIYPCDHLADMCMGCICWEIGETVDPSEASAICNVFESGAAICPFDCVP